MKTCMLFLLFVFLYWGNDIQGQTQEIVLKNYTPSPEAYSLMEYSEIPVSLYTGVPDISIPIYTIRVGNYSLPISLRYHASGIKVGQEASRIGLGWSIHAGGAISRSVRGWDDLKGIGRKRIRFRTKIPNIFGIRYIMIGKITNRIFFIIILMDFPVSFMRIRAREVQV